MVVATTANSGLTEVQEYLEMMLCATGVKIVTDMGSYGTFPKTLVDPEAALKTAHKAADEVYPYITGGKEAETDDDLEECFIIMKNKVTYGAKWLPYEHEYWAENGMLDLKSFYELLNKIQK